MKTTTNVIHYIELSDDEMQNLRWTILMARRLSESSLHNRSTAYQDTFDAATKWLNYLPAKLDNDVGMADLKYDIHGNKLEEETS